MIKLHCYREDAVSMKQEIVSKDFLNIPLDQIYPKLRSKDEFSIALIKLRLGFLVVDLSQHFGIYLVTKNNFKPSAYIPDINNISNHTQKI